MHTAKGEIAEDLLVKLEGMDDSEMVEAHWIEFRLKDDPSGEIVRRDVHLKVKKGFDLGSRLGLVG